jgi:hypothetical protein
VSNGKTRATAFYAFRRVGGFGEKGFGLLDCTVTDFENASQIFAVQMAGSGA